MTRLIAPALLAAILCAFAVPAFAQSPWPRTPPEPPFGTFPRSRQPPPPPTMDEIPRQVISTGPLALLLRLPNAEYEVRAGRYVTFGASATRTLWTLPHRSTSGDVFVRVFPEGLPFNGISVGVRGGYTRIPENGTYQNVGVEGAYTVARDHAYFSLGVGSKWIVGAPTRVFGGWHPILRMNVGIGL